MESCRLFWFLVPTNLPKTGAALCNHDISATAAARHTVGVEPVWPAELEAKTSYSANDISDSVARVISVFCRSVALGTGPHTHLIIFLI